MPIAPKQHRAYPQRSRDADRPNANQRGYNKDWEPVRDAHLALHPECVECWKRGIMVVGMRLRNGKWVRNHVDHIIPHNGIGCPLRLDWNNLQTLCHSCHSRKTATEVKRG